MTEQRPEKCSGKGGSKTQRGPDTAPAPSSQNLSFSEWLPALARGSHGKIHHPWKPHLERDLESLIFPQVTVGGPLPSTEFQFLSKMGIPSLPTSWGPCKNYTVADHQGLAVSVSMEYHFLCYVFHSGMQWQSLYPEDRHHHEPRLPQPLPQELRMLLYHRLGGWLHGQPAV